MAQWEALSGLLCRRWRLEYTDGVQVEARLAVLVSPGKTCSRLMAKMSPILIPPNTHTSCSGTLGFSHEDSDEEVVYMLH